MSQQIKVLAAKLENVNLISALGRQSQMDFCEFKASLVFIVNSRPAGAIGKPYIKRTKKKKKKK